MDVSRDKHKSMDVYRNNLINVYRERLRAYLYIPISIYFSDQESHKKSLRLSVNVSF